MRGLIYGAYTLPVPSANADEYARWRHEDLEAMDHDSLRCERAEVLKAIEALKRGQRLRRAQSTKGKAPGPALTAYIAIAGRGVASPMQWLTERRERLEDALGKVSSWQPSDG